MRLLDLVVPALLAGLAAADAVNDLEAQGRVALDAVIAKSTTCSKDKLEVRREWGDLSKEERRAWIDSVLCLMEKPSQLDSATFPGARNRYDDFVVVHMNQTLTIHGTGNFLVWHRYYVWAFEKALQNECGYKGTQPYWDYGRWQADIYNSPMFDGSDYSVGGNGEPVTAEAAAPGSLGGGWNRPGLGGEGAGVDAGAGADEGMPMWPGMGGVVPREVEAVRMHARQFGGFGGGGTGGGCVTTGPFKNMTVSLGPMAAAVRPAPARNPMANGYGYNPRCLRRDMNERLGQNFGKTSDIANQITNFDSVLRFQNYMQGGSGIHGVGHFTVAGDPGGDFYTSPNEPSFWMHHAMIDRVWTIWQSLDYDNRRMAMEGGTTMMGRSARPQSLDDPTDLGVVGRNYAIRDIMSTVDGPGPFCYVYE